MLKTITKDQYEELRETLISGYSVTAIRQYGNWIGVGLKEARDVLLKEFQLEYKLSMDKRIYECIRRIENFPEINNLPISSDLGMLLEFAREKLLNK